MAKGIKFIWFTGFVILCFLVLESISAIAQQTWTRSYVGSSYDQARSISQTIDGGYIIAGSTHSFGLSKYDVYLIKLSTSGSVVWQKTYGGAADDNAWSVQQTADGGYIVVGDAASFGPLYSALWILKLDAAGDISWQKIYGTGGPNPDYISNGPFSVQQTSDEGYIVAGSTKISNKVKAWALELTSTGNVLWQKTYASADQTLGKSISPTDDGGYIMSARVVGNIYIMILKLDSFGNIIWQKRYGTANERIFSVEQTTDGGFIVAGDTYLGTIGYDFLILKLNSSGDIIWQKNYGGNNDDTATSVQQTSDGGYIIAGSTASFGALHNILVLKLDSLGNVSWQKAYEGGGVDIYQPSYFILQNIDGGYIVAGDTPSLGGGFYDILVLKLDSQGNMDPSCAFSDVTVIVGDSATVATNTNYVADTTFAVSINTDIFGVNRNGISTLICESSSAPGTVSDNDNFPGTPLAISKSGANLILSWSAPGGTCTTEDYGIYRGTLPWTAYNHSSAVCTTGGLTTATITEDTGSYYYVVVAQSAGNEGSYGLDSSDTQRPAAFSPCFPQEIGTCN